jgi:LacI family transcriptional regulator
MGRKPTLRDIAEYVGVSSSTVSRVINSEANVHESTRLRVQKAVVKLGYSQHPIASSLKTGRSSFIHVILESEDSAFMPPMLAGIADRATEAGYRMLLSTLAYERHAMHIDERLIEGVIYIPVFEYSVSLDWIRADLGVPVVCLYGYSESDDVTSIVSDDYGGALIAVQHLLAGGRKIVACINGVEMWIQSQQRFKGYVDGLRGADIPLHRELIEHGDWSHESGFTACERLLRGCEFDAVFAANDKMAAGVLRCLNKHGITVPEQVAVVGFDNRDLCEYVNPQLTSIALPLREMGRRAFDTLIENKERLEIGLKPREQIIQVPCRLVERQSSCKTVSDSFGGTPMRGLA